MRALLLVVTLVLELGAKLALFASALALFQSSPSVSRATLLALVSSCLLFVRSWVRAHSLGHALEGRFDRVLAAIDAKPTQALVSNREHGQGGALVDAIYDVALVDAVVAPDLIGAALSLAVVLGAVALRFGWSWLGLGGVAVAVVWTIFAPVRRAARRARNEGWKAHMQSARLLDAMILGAAELRASSCAAGIGERVRRASNVIATSERTALRLGAAIGLVPALFAAVLAMVPRGWLEDLAGWRLAELGVYAAAGASFALASLTHLESIARAAPLRATLDAFDRGSTMKQSPARPSEERGDKAITSIELRAFTVRYTGSEAGTPEDLSFSLRSGGLAILGPNGCGKTTSLLGLVGLVEPDSGKVLVNGHQPNEEGWTSLRRRVVYLPQRQYVVPDESIAWHVGLFGTRVPTEEGLHRALERLGLHQRLCVRARDRGVQIGELAMGELSAGEQRRVSLCRIVAQEADLVMVDEPESGLDSEGRGLVVKLLADLAERALVVVVSHDVTILPEGFQRIELSAVESKSTPGAP